METVYKDYSQEPHNVQFYYVYKSVAHPQINNYVMPYSLDERLMHVEEIMSLTQTNIPWICDNMSNDIKHAMGGAPNGEFVIDPEGTIVRKRFWSDPTTLRSDLEELVGKVENPTKVEDLAVQFTVPTRKIASGVVKPLKLPRGLGAVKIEPLDDEDGQPFFAKLRAEATPSLLSKKGEGQLLLGFYLDPLYKVHWNNKAGKLVVKIIAPDGVEVSSTTLESPDVETDADIDPRQFLVDVNRGESTEPLSLQVDYVACDDGDTFCIPITQYYEVHFKRNADGGSRPGIFMPEMFAKVRDLDKNQDGNITKDEIPAGQVTLYIGHIDRNGNEIIEADEIDEFLKMFNNGRGFDSALNDGSKARESKDDK